MKEEKCFWVAWIAMSTALMLFCAWDYFVGTPSYWTGVMLLGFVLGVGLIHNIIQVCIYTNKNMITGRLKTLYVVGANFLTITVLGMPLYAFSPVLS